MSPNRRLAVERLLRSDLHRTHNLTGSFISQIQILSTFVYLLICQIVEEIAEKESTEIVAWNSKQE